ncbi:MAG: hypothetical protein JOZ62_24245 [Acidobacteriaceae bacterium]|nr:hypothetical protein [Acidobacteriaceae bacterium]
MPLNDRLVAAAGSVRFASAADILTFFQTATNAHFVDWFNASCAQKANWASKIVGSSDGVKTRFAAMWDRIPLMFDTPNINLLQFSTLMSVIINEAGADLLPCAELCGRAQYPGLAYAFSAIPGVKRSYNSAPLNKLAGDLFFDDADFWSAHGTRPAADLVRASPSLHDEWNGSSYPQQFPTSLDPAISGFIQQGDFFKFRGRGFIQVTWRANYKKLVQFVQSCQSGNGTILGYKAAWTGMDPDVVCTISSNEDWDALFQQSDFIIPCRAIGIHNQTCGNYLALAQDLSTLTALNGTPGSFYYAGWRINGAAGYASLLSQRVVQVLETLAYAG